ncbi:MAG TPA: glycerophosphodiester phosphodiesterase [Gaiellaceae bacterium]
MIELRRPAGGFARVGHRGASALAPENTPAAFELAVELGCDMLEFDVLARSDGTIVVAHDPRHLRDPGLVTFDDALAFFVERLPGVGLQVDLKRRGIEPAVVDALRRHGVLERSWVSGFDADALRRVADLEPALPRSFTYPRDRIGVSKRGPLAPVVRGALKTVGSSLPRRIPALLRRAGATALTLHYSVASREAIERAHELGTPVYVWTVDDPERVERLVRWGADGIITNDPRVFSGLTT